MLQAWPKERFTKPYFRKPTETKIDYSSQNVQNPVLSANQQARLIAVLRIHDKMMISSGNALPLPAHGVVCDIDAEGYIPIKQRARQIPLRQLKKLYGLLMGLHTIVTSLTNLDEALAPVAPPKQRLPTTRLDPSLLYARIPITHDGFVVSFDGPAKTPKFGEYNAAADSLAGEALEDQVSKVVLCEKRKKELTELNRIQEVIYETSTEKSEMKKHESRNFAPILNASTTVSRSTFADFVRDEPDDISVVIGHQGTSKRKRVRFANNTPEKDTGAPATANEGSSMRPDSSNESGKVPDNSCEAVRIRPDNSVENETRPENSSDESKAIQVSSDNSAENGTHSDNSNEESEAKKVRLDNSSELDDNSFDISDGSMSIGRRFTHARTSPTLTELSKTTISPADKSALGCEAPNADDVNWLGGNLNMSWHARHGVYKVARWYALAKRRLPTRFDKLKKRFYAESTW
ncbi:unnamed protein product [Phytophthora fragariaefolia]|uniref:Unnamed protein product n=1 Tax=Phytophthora fragariaefolia TaxID=1490495 RepID=A0A9W7D6D5_9STRA|nr:unnamed protein product [Phytophthora fragariaefolia]